MLGAAEFKFDFSSVLQCSAGFEALVATNLGRSKRFPVFKATTVLQLSEKLREKSIKISVLEVPGA